MKSKYSIIAGAFGFLLLFSAEIASAQLKLVYEGSFKMPNSSAWGDHYYSAIAFVSNGTPRPGWSGAPVTGPSLIAYSGWYPHTVEVNQFPALSKTSAGLGTATWLEYTNGGTFYTSGSTPSFVDGAGDLWSGWWNGVGNIYFDRSPGVAVLGSNQPPTGADTGWPSGGGQYRNGVALRRGDGNGNDLTANAMDIGARFIASANMAGDGVPGYKVYISESVRTSSTTVTGNMLFAAYQTDNIQGRRPVTYVRDATREHEWFVMWQGDSRSGDSFKLDFFASSVTGDVDPTVQYDIGPAITNGAGWLDPANSQIKCVTVDWDNSQLYVLDGYSQDARIHVFTVTATPDIRTVEAANIQDSAADMVGYLPAQTADVICYWGTSDGGTDPASWATNTPMGSITGPFSITNSVSGLVNGTIYFFRYWSSNSIGAAWATNTVQFATTGANPVPSVDNGSGPVSVTATSARMQGRTLSGAPDPHVWIYWGTTDGGDNKANWNKTPIDKGTMGISSFFQDQTGLLANQQYWYRCYASNSVSDAWAPASTNFTTLSPNLGIGAASVTEGNAGTTTSMQFTVTLAATSAVAVTVNYASADGTATLADSDYLATNGTLTIPAGMVTGRVSVTVIGDNTREAAETVLMNLSGAVNANPTNSQATGTIRNDDWTLYVRNGGAGNGNGLTWANAFSTIQQAVNTFVADASNPTWTINIEASSGAQSYGEVSRIIDGDGFHLYANFEGGWQNVDTTPTQTGTSVIQGNGTQRGLDLTSNLPGASSHNHVKIIGVNRLAITSVSDGIRLYNGPNGTGSGISLTLRNSSIAANSNGVVLAYNTYGRIPLYCTNVTIRAGLGGLAGDGVYQEYQPGNMSFDNTTITSAKGRGINVKGVCGVGWLSSYTLTMRDSAVTNCFSDGLYLGEDTFGHYDTALQIILDRARITGNGGMGLFAKRDNGNNQHRQVYFYATNTVVAGNASHGIFLNAWDNQGTDIADDAAVFATLVNSTVANNGGDGIRAWCEQPGMAGSITAYNSIFAGNTGIAISITDYTNNTPIVVETNNNFFANGGVNVMIVGNTETTTNYPALAASDLTVDPKFCAKPPDPFRLALNSPLLDAGTNAVAPAVDILLLARPVGARVSMGAYETGIAGNAGTLFMLR